MSRARAELRVWGLLLLGVQLKWAMSPVEGVEGNEGPGVEDTVAKPSVMSVPGWWKEVRDETVEDWVTGRWRAGL